MSLSLIFSVTNCLALLAASLVTGSDDVNSGVSSPFSRNLTDTDTVNPRSTVASIVSPSTTFVT